MEDANTTGRPSGKSKQGRSLASHNGGRAIPFTFQQHYWRSMAQSNDHLTRLDLPFAIRLSGPLDTELLRRSFEEVLNRHESLRARIVLDGTSSRQYVDEPRPFQLETIRVIDTPAAGLDSPATVVQRLALQRCDLEVGPLFDAKLIHLTDREHLLFWAVNHFIADGWSLNLLARELWLLYRAFVRRLPYPLERLPVAFSDYQVWQQETYHLWLKEHQPYWKHRLAGAMGIRWPVDPLASAIDTARAAAVQISFPWALTAALRHLAKNARTMLSLVLLTVYVAVISRWCSQEDIVVSMLVHGRDRFEHRHVVGLLAHPVYLRVQLSVGETFIDLLGQIGREYHRSLLHKDFGGLVIDTWELVSDTHFNWVPWILDELAGTPVLDECTNGDDLTRESYPVEWKLNVEKDLNLATVLWDSNAGICGSVYYRRECFSMQTVTQYTEDLRCAAQAFAESPHAPIGAVLAGARDRYASLADGPG